MRGRVRANIFAKLTVAAGVLVATPAPGQELRPAPAASRVFPWPQSESSVKRDDGVRRATLVERLDHKKSKVARVSASASAVLVEEPGGVPGVATVDPTQAPPPPPPMAPTIIGSAPKSKATPQFAPPQRESTIPPKTPAPAPASNLVPIPILGPNDAPIQLPVPGPVRASGDPRVPGLTPLPGSRPVMIGAGPIQPERGLAEGVVEGGEGSALAPRSAPSLMDILPGYYVEFGGVYLQRLSEKNVVVAQTQFTGRDIIAQRSKDFDTDFAPGVRFLYATPIGCGCYIESIVYGMNDWSVDRTLNAGLITESFTAFPQVVGSGGLTSRRASFDAWFVSGEGNYKCAVAVYPNSYLIFGLRTLTIIEDFDVVEIGQSATPAGLVGVIGTMDVRAENLIIGPQIGFETRWNDFGRRFSFDSFVKAGVGINFQDVRVDRRITNSQQGPAAVVLSAEDRDVLGFVEVSSAGTYRITPSLAFRGGWQFLGVFGYASAPLQRPFSLFHPTRVQELNDTQDAFFQGFFGSLEWSWGGVR